jgi:hypothetical protein
MHQKHIEEGVANAHWYWVIELGRTCGATGLSKCRDESETFSKPFLEGVGWFNRAITNVDRYR